MIMNVAEFIVKYLENKKIDQVFGVVGGAALWVCKALGESDEIRPMFTNHEQAATMAADGWARMTGKPGVVFSINGPGMTNTITGIAQAWVDSSPVILLCGNSNLDSIDFERENNIRQYGTQDVRTDKIMESITKKYYLVRSADEVLDILDDAYNLSLSGRPGPVCIEIPINIQSAKVKDEIVQALFARNTEVVKLREKDNGQEAFKAVLDKLLISERPLILAGQGIRLSGMVDEFRNFVEKYRIPVVNSRMGIDSINSDSKLFVGRCGNHGSRAAHFAIETCDSLLILGSRLAPNTTGYDTGKFSNQSYKILIDLDANELEKKIYINEKICADLKDFIIYALEDYKCDFSSRHEEWVDCCNDWRKKYPIMQSSYYSNEKLSTYRVVEIVSKHAKDNAIVIADTGSCCSIVAQTWFVKNKQRVFISGGLSAMGYWATSMGIAASNVKQDILCFVGDGSLQMNIHELATLVQYNLPIKLIVISNNGYQFVKMSQMGYGINPPFGTDKNAGVPIPNNEAIVKAYGIRYTYVNEPDQLENAVMNLMETREPIVLEIFVDENQEVCPRLKSRAQEDGSFISPEYSDLYPFLNSEILKKEISKWK